MTSPLDIVLAYHQHSKHSLQRYAPGPRGLDWANQPEPFRWFSGAVQTELPLLHDDLPVSWADIQNGVAVPPQPLTLTHLGSFLQLSLGLSAWKQYGDSRWALRNNPSSGNLHPTEAYLVFVRENPLSPGVCHYLSRDHLLEQRCVFDPPLDVLPEGSFLLGLSSIFWREAWKYGERAYRYCQLDAGHALAALRYAAAVLGWKLQLLASWGDRDAAALMGLDRAEDFADVEPEHPELMVVISTRPEAPPTGLEAPPDTLMQAAYAGQWQGQANRLSPVHGHHWPMIDKVAAAVSKPASQPESPCFESWPPLPQSHLLQPASRMIRRRRSAQAFDGQSTITDADFFLLLDRTLPRDNIAPLDTLPWAPRIHLLLFVHRVEGLAPGLYLLARRTDALDVLQQSMSAEFEWTKVENAPPHLPLRRLLTADAKDAARLLSCHQDIASDSAFAMAMLAEFEPILAKAPRRYRQLFQEAGAIGQLFYLEAEALDLRGTGIGCYFDDDVHRLLGIEDLEFQDMYHFTVGGALEDTRLQTLPPYAHLKR